MRQFVAETFPDLNGCILVEGKKARHLAQVLRLCVGDMVLVRLPDGVVQSMTVASVAQGKKSICLQVAGDVVQASVNKAAPADFSPECELWHFQFVAKPPKMDLILRQAVECGVSRFVPVVGTFCQNGSIDSAVKKSDGSDQRWARLITEAREQSGSAVNTEVLPCCSLKDAVNIWKEETGSGDESVAVVLYEQTRGTLPMHKIVGLAGQDGKIRKAALFVGAEGGISPEEIDFMQKNGIIPVHFATNVLRCETAAVYGIAALQNALVEKDIWQFRE